MSKETDSTGTEETENSSQVVDSAGVTGNGQDNTGAVQEQASGQDYEPTEFDDTGHESDAPRAGDTNLEVILDIPVTLSMEIGRTRVSIQDLLQLAKGSVVELDRMAGEPLDVLVNGTLVARGEVVVVNDKFGVRLNDVISPADRVHMLR